MHSALYTATVRHVRRRPRSHAFRYRVVYGLFDIDELETLAARHRWFGHNRFGVFAFYDRDHVPDDGRPLRAWAETLMDDAGADIRGGSVRILALPRVLGYVFNPISEWYCYDRRGRLAGVIHEVRNTFGDRHWYVRAVDAELSHGVDKQLHVSPFMPMDQRYEFALTPPGERVALQVALLDQQGEMFRASLTGSRLEFSDRNLYAAFFRYPALTLRVTFGIHQQALRLWLKRTPFHRRPDPPAESVTAAHPLNASS